MDKRHSIPRACALALLVAGCGEPRAQTRVQQHVAALDPPQLWRAEALDAAGGIVKTIQVCTNHDMRLGFSRGNAEVNGQTCAPMRDAIEREGLYAVRCVVNGRPFALTVNKSGAPEDYTVRFALKALYGTEDAAISVRRYRRDGPCPAGWAVGDQGPAGSARPTRNALSGVWDG